MEKCEEAARTFLNIKTINITQRWLGFLSLMCVKLLKNSLRASEQNRYLLFNREKQSQEKPASVKSGID